MKSPLLIWQSKDFYIQLLENIKRYGYINELSAGRFKVRELIRSLNFAMVLLNNLRHLISSNTSFSNIMGSKEAADEYFLTAARRVLGMT